MALFDKESAIALFLPVICGMLPVLY